MGNANWGSGSFQPQPYQGGFFGNENRQQWQPQGQSWGQPYGPEYQEQGWQPAPAQPQQQFGYGQSYADRVGQYDQNQQQFDEWQSQNDPRLNVLHSWERANMTDEQIAARKGLRAENRATMSPLQLQAWKDQRQVQRDEMRDWEHSSAAGSMLEGNVGGMSQGAIQGLQAQRRAQEAGLSEFDRRERQQTRNQMQTFIGMTPSQRANFNDTQNLFDRYEALFGISRAADPARVAQGPSVNVQDYGRQVRGDQ